MTAAAARRRPSSSAQLALKSESITTPAKMRISATTNDPDLVPVNVAGHEPNIGRVHVIAEVKPGDPPVDVERESHGSTDRSRDASSGVIPEHWPSRP